MADIVLTLTDIRYIGDISVDILDILNLVYMSRSTLSQRLSLEGQGVCPLMRKRFRVGKLGDMTESNSNGKHFSQVKFH